MKALVHFEPVELDYFEGARMRKTIKGALEITGNQYTTAILDTFDVAHFISPEDEFKIHYALERNIPIVVSALYTEDDENARFLENKIRKDGKVRISLKPKALKMLNNANVVLVPTESARDMLLNFGITTEITVCKPGVNFSRFNFSRIDEKEIFYRYFREDEHKKLVIAMGGANPKKEGIETFLNAAQANPDALFYYIGSCTESKLLKLLKKEIKNAPKNTRFKGVLTDDLHRSALLNADVLFLPGYSHVGIISLYEAIAAKCQIIAREDTIPNDMLSNGNDCYIGKFSETLVSLVTDYLNKRIQPTIENAYNEISKCTIETFGDDLVKIYNKQISLKKLSRRIEK